MFNTGKFRNFWFSTGTPGFLIEAIKKQRSKIMDFENLPVKSYIFDYYDFGNLEIAALLFQTGYLTVKKVTTKNFEETHHLSYPNKEVRDSFLAHLFGEYTQQGMTPGARILERIGSAVETGDIERFIQEIKSLFASVPSHIFIGEREAYYHTIIYLALKLNGAEVRCEESTNIGRIDAVVETAEKIYVMEFKIGSEQEALEQIKAKKYYEKYVGEGKEIFLLGVGFDVEKRNVGDYLLERIPGDG